MERKKSYFKRVTAGNFYLAGQRYKQNEVFEAYPHQISSHFKDIIKQVNQDGSPFIPEYVHTEVGQHEQIKVIIPPKKEEILEDVITKDNEDAPTTKTTPEPRVFLKARSKTWFDVVDSKGEHMNEKALKEDQAKQLVELLNSQQ